MQPTQRDGLILEAIEDLDLYKVIPPRAKLIMRSVWGTYAETHPDVTDDELVAKVQDDIIRNFIRNAPLSGVQA